MSTTDYVSKGVLPGYLQSDPSCNSNLISSINDQFNRLQNSKNLSLRFKLFSPYTDSTLDDPNATRNNITQDQLNMRRKAEILKYKKQLPSGEVMKDFLKEYTVGILTVMIKRKIFELHQFKSLLRYQPFSPKNLVREFFESKNLIVLLSF